MKGILILHGTRITDHRTRIMEQQTTKPDYHQNLKNKMDNYVHLVYKVSKNFPREEMYGTTSQLRRATLSVILNFIEGYARIRSKVYKNFLEISYGSLQESKYLINFSFKENYISENDYAKLNEMADEIGAMLWGILKKLAWFLFRVFCSMFYD